MKKKPENLRHLLIGELKRSQLINFIRRHGDFYKNRSLVMHSTDKLRTIAMEINSKNNDDRKEYITSQVEISEQYSNGYFQCLIDLEEYIDEVSSASDEPPTIEEIIRDFIKPLKSKYKKHNAMGAKISNSKKCSEETQATVSKNGYNSLVGFP